MGIIGATFLRDRKYFKAPSAPQNTPIPYILRFIAFLDHFFQNTSTFPQNFAVGEKFKQFEPVFCAILKAYFWRLLRKILKK